MRVYYGKAVYNNKEISAATKVLKTKTLSLIDGPSVKELEKKISNLFGKKFGLMVNSGSSANLLALLSFYRHRLKLPHLKWSVKFAGNIACGRQAPILNSTSAGDSVVCWRRSRRFCSSWWRRLGSSNHDCHVHV